MARSDGTFDLSQTSHDDPILTLKAIAKGRALHNAMFPLGTGIHSSQLITWHNFSRWIYSGTTSALKTCYCDHPLSQWQKIAKMKSQHNRLGCLEPGQKYRTRYEKTGRESHGTRYRDITPDRYTGAGGGGWTSALLIRKLSHAAHLLTAVRG